MAKSRRKRPRKNTGVDGKAAPLKLETIGAHRYNVATGRCHYCHMTREEIDDQPGSKCVRKAERVALDKMAARTPLRLTAEDEQIMREDWGLDPHKLPQVRIYQQLLQEQRHSAALQQRISVLETVDMDELGEPLQTRARLEAEAGKPRTPAIRHLSRQFNVWPAAADYRPGEVLLATEIRNGIEYAFIARDQVEADRACNELRHVSEIFPWLMRESTKESKT